MSKIEAKIIADSVNSQGDRITSMLVTFPRMIHSEVMTHRMLSKNSASSRAIPFEKMVKSVQENPFIPIAWQRTHSGMQGTEYLDGIEEESAIDNWLLAKNSAIKESQCLYSNDVTKQLCNRLLEPFMWHTVLITATEFSNFFELRCPSYVTNAGTVHKSKKDFIEKCSYEEKNIERTDIDWLRINKGQSEIHIMALAESMYDALIESTPKQLQPNEWHIPYQDIFNWDEIRKKIPLKNQPTDLDIKIATAICARTSYTIVGEEGKTHNYEKDIQLHDMLAKSGHWSPFEHCARAMSDDEYNSYIKGNIDTGFDIPKSTLGWCNNFKGFIQYRELINKI